MELTQDDRQDAVEILEFFVRLADQDADLVGTYLRAAGFEPGSPLSQDTLLRLTVFCRLRYWETSGIAIDPNLPSSEDVFADVIGKLEGRGVRFETRELCRRVQIFALRQLTWPQTSGEPNFALEDRSTPTDFLDSVAEFLWEFRHLAAPAAASEPPANRASSGPGSSADIGSGS